MIFWSVLYCDKAYTAQMVAGNQPNKVICKIKQITPAIGLPMVKNVSHGKNKAINNLMLDLSVSGDIGATIIAEMAGCHQIAAFIHHLVARAQIVC